MSLGKWDRRFMNMADLVATWSKDPSTRVGCAVVDERRRVVSVGFNGAPRGVSDVIMDRDQKLRRSIHAEMNAVAFANCDLAGCTVYVTAPPCANCAAMLVQRGIHRVVFRMGDEGFMERWKENYDDAIAMFCEADVKVEVFEVLGGWVESEGGEI